MPSRAVGRHVVAAGYLANSYDAIDIIQYVNTVKSLWVYQAKRNNALDKCFHWHFSCGIPTKLIFSSVLRKYKNHSDADLVAMVHCRLTKASNAGDELAKSHTQTTKYIDKQNRTADSVRLWTHRCE